MITFRTDVAADRHKLQPSGFNHNAIMELGGLWDSGNEGSAAAIEAWMQRLRCPPNEMGQGGVNGFRVVNDPRLYVERRLDMDESESSHAVLRCADLA